MGENIMKFGIINLGYCTLSSVLKIVYFCLSSLILLLDVAAYAQDNKKPNIVLIVADDHGTDALGCYGNPVIKTPNLDLLATEGVRFTNAFCTSSSCSPRTVILTGMHNHANGMYGLEHSFHHFSSLSTIKSLPVFLSESGYTTARIGKYHVAPKEVYKFDVVLSEGAANDNASLGRSPVEMADKCENFLRENNTPFLLYFCLDDPHRGLPFDSWPGPNPFGNRAQGYPGVKDIKYHPDRVIVPSFLPDIAECRSEIAQYYQSVSRLDQGIGRLVDWLKRTGKYENTLIIYISDNGIAFPGAKTTLYDPGMKLPYIVKLPEQKYKNSASDAMISWVDITPTILDFAGVKTEEVFHGRSFKPVFGKSNVGWDEVYASHTMHEVTMYYPMRVIRNRKYKLIWNLAHELTYPFALDLIESSTWKGALAQDKSYYAKRKIETFLNRPEFELYDLEKDPDELHNLSSKVEFKTVLDQMKQKLKNFQERTNDPWIYKWEYE
jgi:N-sulfoglucosamine sulfohydrolase